jgi:ankyrin repeat protein
VWNILLSSFAGHQPDDAKGQSQPIQHEILQTVERRVLIRMDDCFVESFGEWSLENTVFSSKQFKKTDIHGDNKLDENKIRLQIMTSISGLICLQQTKNTMKKPESRLFFRALSEIGRVFAFDVDDAMEAADMEMDRRSVISGFTRETYLTKTPTEGNWCREHWACLLGSKSGLRESEILNRLEHNPAALVQHAAIPACHLAATTLYPSIHLLHSDAIIEYYCPRLAHLTDVNGETALHYVARYSRSVDVLRWILSLNPKALKIQTKCEDETPLHKLVKRKYSFSDRVPMLHQLLASDISVALTQNQDGDTPLHLLCNSSSDSTDIGTEEQRVALMEMRQEMLAACPAAAMIANSCGRLPLHCVFSGDSDVRFLKQLIAVYPEGLQVKDEESRMPIHCAAANGSLPMLEAVLEAYPDVILRNDRILHVAAHRRDPDGPGIVRYLHERNSKLIRSSDSGWYPLHVAAEWGSCAMLKLVHGLYPEAVGVTSNGQRTLPLHVLIKGRAFKSAHADETDMLRYLLRHHPSAVALPAGPKDGNKNAYKLALDKRLPDFVRRLLLRAAPELDPHELHKLNYAARRMALFLAHCAICRGGGGGGGGRKKHTLITRLRALARRNVGELFQTIVSFL